MARFIDLFTNPNVNPDDRKEEINDSLKEGVELPGIGHRYTLIRYLASGLFGDVFSAIDETEKPVAIKIVRFLAVSFLEEVLLYQKLMATCSAYVVCLYDAFFFRHIDGSVWLVIVQELMEGDILTLGLLFDDTSYLLYFLLLAAQCLHDQGIAHMDIKPDNIYYKYFLDTLIFKLGDTGLACAKGKIQGTVINTPVTIKHCQAEGTFLPPNFLQPNYRLSMPIGFEHAVQVDMWSIGATIYLLLAAAGYYPKKNMDIIDLFTTKQLRDREFHDLKLADRLRTQFIKTAPTDGFLSQKTVENALATLLDYKKQRTIKDVLYQIIRDQNWAKPGEEERYLASHKLNNSC